ncbi:MAG TPA: 6-phospho-3-hexuloisomerase [Candidatus Bathyarchaeia archaeon]|nr:6-phospho-3-hexuloisomerase [Candidatus Bathyarchaeia archaeon]
MPKPNQELRLFREAYEEIMKSVANAIGQLDTSETQRFIELLVREKSRRILIIGVGRSGLIGRAFAMRLMHLGFNVYVMGETITPAIGKGDLVIVISGSGTTKLAVTAAEIGKEVGARVVAITSFPKSDLGKLADHIVQVRGRTKVAAETDYFTRQITGVHEPLAPLGTIFEIASTVFLDSLIPELMHRLGRTGKELKRRHATIE